MACQNILSASQPIDKVLSILKHLEYQWNLQKVGQQLEIGLSFFFAKERRAIQAGCPPCHNHNLLQIEDGNYSCSLVDKHFL